MLGLARLGRAPLDWLAGWWRIVFFGAQLQVLALSPSSYAHGGGSRLLRHLYLDTAPILWWFTALSALLTLVITRIVIVTALSYGLSQYALEMVIRVLVLELIPLTAALFVALRCTIPNGAALA
ncbi:MAG: ABC transporter permease, partial [Ramlibacter sp.]|nr:ABC transporter permease [Ramlibacter sp.]